MYRVGSATRRRSPTTALQQHRGIHATLTVDRPRVFVHRRATMSSPSQHAETRMEALYVLVLELFSVEEFRRWLRYSPDADILVELPGASVPDSKFVEETLASLERRGLIDRMFFTRMITARKRKEAAITEVAARWDEVERVSASPQASSPQTTYVPSAVVDRQELRRMLQRHLPTDADLDAFGHDVFPNTARRWSAGMDRLQKTTLLLNCEGAAEVRARMLAYTGNQE